MIDTRFLSGLAKFNLIVRKRVISNYSGPRKSNAQGRGLIYSDHRVYSPGDDFRSIDWKVFARTDDLMIKNFEEERNLILHVLVDKSRSMDFGKPSKFDYAAMLGVGHAYLAMKRNDKFQFSTFDDGVDIYQPRRGMSQILAMVDYMNGIKPGKKTDFLGVVKSYSKHIGSRSMILIVSDFLGDIERIKESLHYLKGNEVKVLQILDPLEMNPSMEGDFRITDSESSKAMRAFISLRALDQYKDRLSKHTAQIQHQCEMLQMDFHRLLTDTPIFEAFYQILGR